MVQHLLFPTTNDPPTLSSFHAFFPSLPYPWHCNPWALNLSRTAVAIVVSYIIESQCLLNCTCVISLVFCLLFLAYLFCTKASGIVAIAMYLLTNKSCFAIVLNEQKMGRTVKKVLIITLWVRLHALREKWK